MLSQAVSTSFSSNFLPSSLDSRTLNLFAIFTWYPVRSSSFPRFFRLNFYDFSTTLLFFITIVFSEFNLNQVVQSFSTGHSKPIMGCLYLTPLTFLMSMMLVCLHHLPMHGPSDFTLYHMEKSKCTCEYPYAGVLCF